MRLRVPLVVTLGCFATIFLVCYAAALYGDRQFGYRDAGHYYYPLYQRVQKEWDAGRWPLWEREENSGVPLVGNPTAAVFYPGKLAYACLPYAWAARVYIVAHTALAFFAMLALLRSWQTSWTGSGVAALAYAFGSPILFQFCNVIYLVGAAWLPLAMRAADRWVRLGRRWAILELALTLAMMTLGGDPQSAYLVGLAAGGYALAIAWSRARAARMSPAHAGNAQGLGIRLGRAALVMGTCVIAWAVATVALAQWLPKFREPGTPTPPLRWMLHVPLAVSAAWALAGLLFLQGWRRRGWRLPLGIMWLGLAASAALAVALSAVQFFPVFEFTQLTVRAAGGGPHDIYPFSLEPFRLVELLWPNILGIQFEGNTYWLDCIALPGVRPKIWIPSLYLGGLSLVLAASALAFRKGPPWRVWLSVIVLASALGSLGAYTSPIWWTRALAESVPWPPIQQLMRGLGPLDPADATPVRLDGYLRDGDGGIYWWMTTLLPGFRQFRFPSKLLTFTTLGLAALAGLGWDQLASGRSRAGNTLLVVILTLSVATLAVVLVGRQPIVTAFQSANVKTAFGPFQPEGGYNAILRSLLHAVAVLGAGLVVARLARARPQLAGCLVLVVMTADLAVANARYVQTVPQALFEKTPELVRLIEALERDDPAPGPFRIHRMPLWSPGVWHNEASPDRVLDFVTWERDTLQPKYGITFGIEYTHTIGVAELYDYEWYFCGFPRIVRRERVAKALGVELGKEIVYYPRRAFDMWNTRYFVLPSFPNGWRDEMRGTASFLMDAKIVHPPPHEFLGQGGKDALRRWIETKDFQIVRNLNTYPRAWIVHEARGVKPVTELSRENRAGPMQEITYPNDDIWSDDTMHAFDPRVVAWLDTDTMSELGHFLSYPGRRGQVGESVQVSYPRPDQAILKATLSHPGIVILSDVFYPGWELTIDGKPAPIHVVNRLMRGAAVEAGTHRLVYTYNPKSFRIGQAVSIGGLAMAALLAFACVLRNVDPVLAADAEPTLRHVESDRTANPSC
jgi:hypothetical protein